MRILGFLLMGLLTGSATAQQIYPPYGLMVSESELRFMSGLHSRAVDLELGRKTSADYATAAETYRKSAVLGFPLSQNNLARLYETGLGVPRDPVVAHVWYLLAAASGDSVLVANRDRSARHLMPDQIASAEHLATTLKQYLPAPSR
jgi:TPR repeat protein